MTPFAARFAFLAFAMLTGAMGANIFVFQPPARQWADASQTASSVAWRDPARVPGDASARGEKAIVPPLETGAVKPGLDGQDRADLTRAIQRELKAKGYETGAVDGVPGLVTRGAIMAYESDAGLPLTGVPREALLQHIVLGPVQARSSDKNDRIAPGPEAEEVIRAVQRAFRQLGYIATLPDGRLNDATRRAIRKFELDRKLDETGRISGELLAKLASLAGDALQASRQ